MCNDNLLEDVIFMNDFYTEISFTVSDRVKHSHTSSHVNHLTYLKREVNFKLNLNVILTSFFGFPPVISYLFFCPKQTSCHIYLDLLDGPLHQTS